MYFAKQGRDNTIAAIEAAVDAARERGIKHIVVASNTGETAEKLMGLPCNVVCVTHAYGYKAPGENEMSEATRLRLQQNGVKVLTTSHILSGVERGISGHSGGMYPGEIISYALRMFGQGMKVCVEISTMALDAGLIPHGEKIVAIGGTGRGADTAIIIKPAHASEIFSTYINEIICKPS